MKFCFFSTQYLPTVGGVERYTFNIAKLLISRGHRVTVVTSSVEGLPERETDEYGINVIRVPSYPVMGGRFPFVKITKFFPQAKQILQDVDFCVIQTRFYPLSVAAAIACKKRKIKTIVIDHSTGHMPMGSGIVGKVAALYEHIACRIIKICGHDFYGVSGAVSKWLTHFKVESKGRMYNAIDPDSINSELAENPVDFRQKLNLKPEEKIISFAGRLIPEKGVEILIDAFEKAKLENTSLLIAGDGMLYEKLSAEKRDNVYLLGSLPHNNTLQLMTQSQVYCLPTMYAEGFPTTFLEAAACHCPVITTVTGGSSEFMPDESYGIEIQKLSVESLTQAIVNAMGDADWRRTASQKAYKNLMDNFTWTKTCDKLEHIASDKS